MTDWPLTAEAAGQFLRSIPSAEAFAILVHPEGEGWVLAAQHGRIDHDLTLAAAQSFDPEEGGAVMPLKDGGGWLARYSCAAPGLELCVLMRFPQVSPDQLHPSLDSLEERTGWLLVAALRDASLRAKTSSVANALILSVLLDASGAGSEEALGQQWIARLEHELQPGAIMVVGLSALGTNLLAISGGGNVAQPSDRRDAIETIAASLRDRRQAFALSQDPVDLAKLPAYMSERLLPQLEALGLERCLVLPVLHEQDLAMAVLVGWDGPQPGDEAPLADETLDVLARALSDSLTIYRKSHPSLQRQIQNWATGLILRIFGPRAWKIKLIGAGFLALLAVLAVLPGQQRPTFNASLSTQDRRVVAAPFDGYLAQAPWRVGDVVPEGEVLMAMNDAELTLQRVMTEAEMTRLMSQSRMARAEGKIADLRSLEAEAEQVRMRLELIDYQIAAAKVLAPKPVQILAGDANARIGARMRLGEPLLEIGDPSSMVVMAQIEEDWVSEMGPGLPGTLLLAAWPDRPLAVRLEQITADAQMLDGKNGFRSRMIFDQDLPADLQGALLEGMRGVVRIEAGQSSLLANYTRGLRRWFGSFLWQMG